jgi:hypothetical protein
MVKENGLSIMQEDLVFDLTNINSARIPLSLAKYPPPLGTDMTEICTGKN